MAEIKTTMTVSLEEFGKKAGEYALDEYEYNGMTIRQWADKITSGEYQPVRHGRWIHDMVGYVKCSVCNDLEEYVCVIFYNFCPNCGAKMDKEG